MSSSKDLKNKIDAKQVLIASVFLVLALLFAWVEGAAWSRRVAWDTVSYLDLGDAFLKGDWKAALSSYWSPLYGILFAVFHRFFNGIPELDLLLVFNFIIFILLALTFGYLVHALRKSLAAVDPGCRFLLPDNLFSVVVYTTFIYCSLTICGVRYKTPDVLSALAVLSFFCLWQRTITQPVSTIRSTFIGVLLGSCYLAKNSLVNWDGLVILMLFYNRKLTKMTKKQLVSLAVAAVVTILCWAIPSSVNIGHFTLTDTLTVSKAWMITLTPGLKHVHGQGPTFKHPTREFFKNPDFYEFAGPFDVSYPPWFAPAYFSEGVPFTFSLPYFLSRLFEKIPILIMSYMGILIFGFGSLFVLGRRSPFSNARLRTCLPMILPSAAGLGALAAFFDPDGRYMLPYILPLFVALFLSLKAPDNKTVERWHLNIVKAITAYMAVASMLVFIMHFYFFSPTFANSVKGAMKMDMAASPPLSPHEPTIKALNEMGVVEGDRMARVSTLGHGEFYWSRGGKFKVVAECVNPKQFAEAPFERRQQVYEKLRKLGVKAIVEDWTTEQEKYPICNDPGWINVPGTRNWIYKL